MKAYEYALAALVLISPLTAGYCVRAAWRNLRGRKLRSRVQAYDVRHG